MKRIHLYLLFIVITSALLSVFSLLYSITLPSLLRVRVEKSLVVKERPRETLTAGGASAEGKIASSSLALWDPSAPFDESEFGRTLKKSVLKNTVSSTAVSPASQPGYNAIRHEESVTLHESSTALLASSSPLSPALPLALPPLNETAIKSAVVKIQCPDEEGVGFYAGSGFALEGGRIVTAAHVVKDSRSKECDVIFPEKNTPRYYLKGTIQDIFETKRRHDEDGIDIAFISLPQIDAYPEARALWKSYPSVPYQVCGNPAMRGDALLHIGYPSNYKDQNYLSELQGQAVKYASIEGVKEQLSEDQTYTFRAPVLKFTDDETGFYPYMTSRVPSFYGDSGGLVFNVAKQCILGVNRGGTVGKGAGENYSLFTVMGWESVKKLIPSEK